MSHETITVTIEGPQGSGKSRLAETFGYDLEQRAFRVHIDPDAPIAQQSDHPTIVIRTTNTSKQPTRNLYQSLDDSLAAGIERLVATCHGAAVKAGWWTDLRTGESLIGQRNVGEILMLAVSELSEGMEGDRKNLMDDKLTHRPMIEVEIADFFIRAADNAGADNLPIADAIKALLPFDRRTIGIALAMRTLADFIGSKGYDLGGAIVEKLAFNAQRPDHKIEARLAAGGKRY